MKQITSVDGTIPLPALLWIDEQRLASQPAVGLYWGALKAPRHQNGTIHLTSHRLIYLDAQYPARNSLAILLSSVKETEHYAGFLTSSPKVTLLFRDEDAGAPGASLSGLDDEQEWTCQVCDERNLGGDKCKLCGVPKDAIETTSPPLASSLPTRISILRSVSPPIQEIACTACTYFNSVSRKTCEICETPLPTLQTKSSKSAPISRASSPGAAELDDPDELDITAFKISFRKGGDKPFYTLLKRSLKSKAWVVCIL
jgi:ESCRT-II complex subunit VPS36